MKNDAFGDRMKKYEHDHRTIVSFDQYPDNDELFLYLRLDGRSFSRFTRKLSTNGHIVKPRDLAFEKVFIRATEDTVGEFGLALGFHQSDEISLFFKPYVRGTNTDLMFGGNISKIISVVSSYFTARFIAHFHNTYDFIPEISFDCRHIVFTEKAEAVNVLVWRYQDATRNVIQDYAHHHYGHSALMHMSTTEKLLKLQGDYPDFTSLVLENYGNFVKRVTYTIEPTDNAYTNDSYIRSRNEKVDVKFGGMGFTDRMELVYGK